MKRKYITHLGCRVLVWWGAGIENIVLWTMEIEKQEGTSNVPSF